MIVFFFSKLGKKSPKFRWEQGWISAPEETKKSLSMDCFSGVAHSLFRSQFSHIIISRKYSLPTTDSSMIFVSYSILEMVSISVLG